MSEIKTSFNFRSFPLLLQPVMDYPVGMFRASPTDLRGSLLQHGWRPLLPAGKSMQRGRGGKMVAWLCQPVEGWDEPPPQTHVPRGPRVF